MDIVELTIEQLIKVGYSAFISYALIAIILSTAIVTVVRRKDD